MSKELKFTWPFGDFRGQNIYEFSQTEDGKLYCYASRRDLKKDLLAIREGRYVMPWGKHAGKLISEVTPWLRNQVRQGTQDRLYHVERALKINSESSQ